MRLHFQYFVGEEHQQRRTGSTASFGNFLGKTIEGAAPSNASKSLIRLYKGVGVGNERAANGDGDLLNYGTDKAFEKKERKGYITVPSNVSDQHYWNNPKNW